MQNIHGHEVQISLASTSCFVTFFVTVNIKRKEIINKMWCMSCHIDSEIIFIRVDLYLQ